MLKESRQVKRARLRRDAKKTSHLITHELYYIPMVRKSRSGVEYIYYKKIVDVIGLRKENGYVEKV